MKIATLSPFRIAFACCAALLLASTTASAIGPNEVIAESVRAKVTMADYDAELDKLPPASRAEFAANRLRLTQFLDTLYISRVLAADARAAGLDKDPLLASQIATQVDRMLTADARAAGIDKDPLLARQIAIQVDRMLSVARYAQLEAEAVAQFDKTIDVYTVRAREIYLSTRTRYAVPEQVRAAHILVKINDGNAEAARNRAEEVRAKALAGANFTGLAKEYSEDPSVARNGGELGYFEKKDVDPDFAAAAFAMTKNGEVSGPVKSAFGYHIILFEGRRPAGVKPFDEVKAEILDGLRRRVKDDARAAAVRDVFSDPTLKVNNALIEQINVEGANEMEARRSKVPKP